MTRLHRYWLEFAMSSFSEPTPLRLGCGVTAHAKTDALEIVRTRVFHGGEVPTVVSVIEDVDLSTLDPRHVLPNIGNPAVRGVWFPLGFG